MSLTAAIRYGVGQATSGAEDLAQLLSDTNGFVDRTAIAARQAARSVSVDLSGVRTVPKGPMPTPAAPPKLPTVTTALEEHKRLVLIIALAALVLILLPFRGKR